MAKDRELIEHLVKKFDLIWDKDVFEKIDRRGKTQYIIINRRGMDKIEARSDATVDWKVVSTSPDHVYLEFWAKKNIEVKDGDEVRTDVAEVHTSGEADRGNVQQVPAYLFAMAEARGRSRALLKIEGLYEAGFFSEDEADDFKDLVREKTFGVKSKAAPIEAKDEPSDLKDFFDL